MMSMLESSKDVESLLLNEVERANNFLKNLLSQNIPVLILKPSIHGEDIDLLVPKQYLNDIVNVAKRLNCNVRYSSKKAEVECEGKKFDIHTAVEWFGIEFLPAQDLFQRAKALTTLGGKILIPCEIDLLKILVSHMIAHKAITLVELIILRHLLNKVLKEIDFKSLINEFRNIGLGTALLTIIGLMKFLKLIHYEGFYDSKILTLYLRLTSFRKKVLLYHYINLPFPWLVKSYVEKLIFNYKLKFKLSIKGVFRVFIRLVKSLLREILCTLKAIRGVVIVFEGIDASGKTTHAKTLCSTLSKTFNVKYVHLEESSLLVKIKEFFRRGLGIERSYIYVERNDAAQVHSHGKFKRTIQMWGQLLYRLAYSILVLFYSIKHDVVIVDRYIYETFCSFLAQGISKDKLLKYHKLFLKPDIVLLLDVPAEIAYCRRSDLRHHSLEFYSKERNYLLTLARTFNFYVISTTKSIEEVRKEILSVLCSKFPNLRHFMYIS